MKRIITHSRPGVDARELDAVVAALKQGHFSQGEEVRRLEEALSKFYGGAEVVAVSSGTAALYLALAALGVPKTKRVIIPSYTCNSLYAAVTALGSLPVCVDVPEGGPSLVFESVRLELDGSIAALIVPHTCGYQAGMEEMCKTGIPVIEDCAQAVGGVYPDGSLLGSKGDVAVLSFYGTKLLPAGEGGACVTKNPSVAATLRSLRNCDESDPLPGAFNFKMSDIGAALACAKLKRLQEAIDRREQIAARYDEAFGQFSFRRRASQKQAVCFRYLLEIDGEVDGFLAQAESQGIMCRRPIWKPLHHSLGGHCPHTERLEKTLVSVPIYPNLEQEEVEGVCKTLSALLKYRP